MFGDLGDYGVAESSQSVHPRGNPMSHSTHVGFSCPPVDSGSTASSSVSPSWCEDSAFRRTAVRKFGPPARPWCPGPPEASALVGVGHRLCRAIVSNDGRTAAPSDGDWFDP